MLLVPLYMLYELAIVAIRLTHWRAARAARASEKKEGAEPQTNVGPDSPPGGGRVGESGPI
jgi:sec-independent protein translocase protein TatC